MVIYFVIFGLKGVREFGEVIFKNIVYLKKCLVEVGEIVFDGVNFKDVLVRFEVLYSVIYERFFERNIYGGYYIGKYF